MKASLRVISTVLAALLLLGLLAGCGAGSGKTVPVADLAGAVSTALGKADSMAESDGTFLGLTGADADKLGEYRILINRYGANIDEFGIFSSGDEKDSLSAQKIKALVENYLARRLDIWMEEYMPEEKPKLENAEVRVKGDYVMYCILSDADKTTAFKAFENALR